MSGTKWEELQRRDAAARRLAQTEFTRPVIVEAGAGTGKTATLVARVVAWALGPGWARAASDLAAARPHPPAGNEEIAARVLGGVVAITFTEAAAGEMAARVGKTLQGVALGRGPGWLLPESLAMAGEAAPERARLLLTNLDRLVVSTIHAYCRRLLATFPLEAGWHPAFTVDADGDVLDAVVREVVAETATRALGPTSDPDWVELAAAGHAPRELAAAVGALARCGVSPDDLAAEPFAPSWRHEQVSALGGAAVELARVADPLLGSAKRVPVAQEVVVAAAATAARVTPDTAASLEAFDQVCEAIRETWSENARKRLQEWAEGTFGLTESRVLGDAAASVHTAAARLTRLVERFAELHPALLQCVRRVTRPLLVDVRQRLRARGVVTFNDLLRGARDLVQSHPSVARRWRREVRQVLLDEFQDTDRLQCDLVAALVLDGRADERPGLFMVGDPKQSIYGWRNADLAAVQALVQRIEAEAGGIKAELCVSFRAAPVLLDAVETWVAPHMVEQPGVQPPFQLLAPCPAKEAALGFRQDQWAPVELWVSWREEEAEAAAAATRSGDATELEAVFLASDLRALHDKAGVPWGDVGILMRSSSDLDVYLQALRDAGVPFAVERDRSYYQRREILDAAALVRAVVDPLDHIALVAWLRSPAVGVPDAAWLPLWRRRFPELVSGLRGPDESLLATLEGVVADAAAAVPREVPGLHRLAGWPDLLAVALRHLAELRASLATEPAVRFVERLRTLTLVEATEAARFQGLFRLANLERFFRRLAASLNDGAADPQAALRALRRAVEERRNEEEARPTAALGDAVRVLTIHRAKGLDFGHVYLLQTHKGSGKDTRVANVAWETPRGWEYRLLGAATPGCREVELGRRQVAEAEMVRTLYVAMTRAKDRLVVAGRWPAPGKPAEGGTHMALLAAGVELPEAGQDGVADDPRGRFLFLARRPTGPTASPKAAAAGGTLLEATRVELEALAVARRAAGERQARPFSLAASAEAHAALAEALAARQGREGEAVAGDRPSHGADGAATLVGAAVHWMLETLPLDRPLLVALAQRQEALAGWAVRHTPAALAEQVVVQAREVLASFAASSLAGRWNAVAAHVIGREVPLLLPPAGSQAVGYISGQIDLLFRDPSDGALVVVDYKTDRVADHAALQARAEVYASQCLAYVRGVSEAFSLTVVPRWELWFLSAGRVVVGSGRTVRIE